MRLLTARECARLQGVKDDFRITVPLNQALFGFGDAVCVPVVRWIAEYYLSPTASELMRGRVLETPKPSHSEHEARLEPQLDITATIGEWLQACTRNKKISRNTIAGGLVLLDRLREKFPVSEHDLFSSGGELKGSRSGLPLVLAKYDLPEKFLKEATTRQVPRMSASWPSVSITAVSSTRTNRFVIANCRRGSPFW